MKKKFTYWKESDGMYLGYLNEFSGHWTQGKNLDDLKEHLLPEFDYYNLYLFDINEYIFITSKN